MGSVSIDIESSSKAKTAAKGLKGLLTFVFWLIALPILVGLVIYAGYYISVDESPTFSEGASALFRWLANLI